MKVLDKAETLLLLSYEKRQKERPFELFHAKSLVNPAFFRVYIRKGLMNSWCGRGDLNPHVATHTRP